MRMELDYIPLYEIYSGEELRVAQLIQQRRIQMLVHSCIYYFLDDTIIEDFTWGKWAKELAELQEKYPEISEMVWWHEAFKGWEGSSGFNLPLTDDWVMNKAQQLLRWKRTKKERDL